MMDKNDKLEITGEESADVLLQQLLHLKRYEMPETARMTKNRQNIMRQVREESLRKRWSLGDLLEVNIPWFFAEPRYGIAALFIAFAALQFWGVSSQKQASSKTGIYTSTGSMVAFDQTSSISTNRISYPKLPDGLELFPSQRGTPDVKFVGRLEKKK
jgi:hypothetical protein